MIRPERVNVHGLSEEFLKDFPVFADVADAFLDFIGDDISQDGDGIPERYLNLDGLPLLPPSAQERARVNQMSTERAQEAYKTILMSGGFDEMWPKQV